MLLTIPNVIDWSALIESRRAFADLVVV